MTIQKKPAPKNLRANMIKQMIALTTSGFGLVAALAWNNVIQEFVKVYLNTWLPQGGGVVSLLLYAIVVTAIAIFVTYQLTKLSDSSEE